MNEQEKDDLIESACRLGIPREVSLKFFAGLLPSAAKAIFKDAEKASLEDIKSASAQCKRLSTIFLFSSEELRKVAAEREATQNTNQIKNDSLTSKYEISMNKQEQCVMTNFCSKDLGLPTVLSSAYCKGDIETARKIVRLTYEGDTCGSVAYQAKEFKATGLFLLFVADAMQEFVDEREATNDAAED